MSRRPALILGPIAVLIGLGALLDIVGCGPARNCSSLPELPHSNATWTAGETWVPVLENTWPPPTRQPSPDGSIEEGGLEYANGVRIEINNFNSSGENGELYLAASGKSLFTTEICQQWDGSPCDAERLDIGMRVAAQWGNESGSFTVLLDAERQASLAGQSCEANGSPTRKPGPEDRKIVVEYLTVQDPETEERSVTIECLQQYRGDCDDWVPIAAGSSDIWDYDVAMDSEEEDGELWTTAELGITLRRRSDQQWTSQALTEELLGLGVKHRVRTPLATASFGYFPSVYQKPPLDLDTLTWQTLDLGMPEPIPLSLATYNVGQMVEVVDDGGQGEFSDIAWALFLNDVSCVLEEMEEGERNDLMSTINAMRLASGMSLAHAYFPPDGDAPNNMIISATPILAADNVLYGTFPDLDDCYSDECVGQGPGFKGIVWARIATRTHEEHPGVHSDLFASIPPKSESVSADDFIDVFCTHTQADYNSDGEYHGVRGFHRLQQWANQKRSGILDGLPNGLDRPAFLLGDLNQMGPKSISPFNHGSQIANWIATETSLARGPNYQSMLQQLELDTKSPFDQVNDYSIDLYDLSALADWGTWITTAPDTNISDTVANDCTPAHPTPSQRENAARVDYVMVLPPETDFPAYVLVGDPAGNDFPGVPTVSVDYNEGSWTDGSGCISDHAEINARVGLLRTNEVLHYNPNRTHDVTYQVTSLFDWLATDGGATDWYVGTDGFRMHRFPDYGQPENLVFESGDDWSDEDDTADGILITPTHWRHTMATSGTDLVNTFLSIWDWDDFGDDHYDLTSLEAGRSNPRLRFKHAYPGAVWQIRTDGTEEVLVGTVDPSYLDPEARCRGGCYVMTQGNGDGTHSDDNAIATHLIKIDEQ